jgi:hypothetical protein
MDVLNLQPDALTPPDDTFEVEGYEDHIEDIEQAYPEEDFRTPAEKAEDEGVGPEALQQASDEAFQEGSVGQTIESSAELPQQQQAPVEGQVQQTQQPTKFTFTPDPTTGLIPDEQLYAAYGEDLPDGVKFALKLNHAYLDGKEGQLRELFSDGNNLEKQYQAFTMIRDDQELTDRYDRNGDGEITYSDFFDVTNLADFNEDMDAYLTQEWLEGLQAKDGGARLKALWQQNGAGQNMARYINLRREHALSDKGEGSETSYGFNRNKGEGVRQNTAGGLFDLTAWSLETVGSVGDVLQGKSWHDDSTLDDNTLQHKNENSLEYLVNHNLERSALDTLSYEFGYWAIPSYLTGGAFGAVGKTLQLTGVPAAIKVGQFLKPSLTGGKVINRVGASGKLVSLTYRPASGWLGKQKMTQAANMILSGGKTVFMDTLPLAAMTNLEEEGRGMMQEDGILKKFYDSHPEAIAWIPGINKGVSSPMFKQADFMFTEGVLGTLGTVALGGVGKSVFRRSGQILGELPKIPGKTVRYAQGWLDANAVSLRNHSGRIEAEFVNQESLFNRTQEQLTDWFEAGWHQAKRGAEGASNAFSNAVETDGVAKSAYGVYSNGVKIAGQGYSKARDGIRQVLNDWDEILHTIGISRPGSTNSLFSQTGIAKAAKSGISEGQLDSLTKQLIDDVDYKAQIRNLDPLSRRGRAADTSLDGIKEVILGRDASRTSPSEFWGDDFLEGPMNIDDFSMMGDFEKWAVKNIQVADAVNRSLLLQLRDQANAASEMIGKTDIFATDGMMRKVGDNLVIGLHQVKKTRFTWDEARRMMTEKGGKLSPEDLIELNAKVAEASSRLHTETKAGVNTMARMLQEQGDDELAGAVLDVFKVSNDIHNWKDFDAWMHQQIVGGKFKGQVKTGDLIHGLQKVMVQSILSGPKTPGRAILGTTINSYLNTMNEAFGATLRLPFTNDVVAFKSSIAKLKGQMELIPDAFSVFRKEWNAKFNADIADIQTRYTEAGTPGDDLWEAKRIHTELRGTDGEKAAFYINNVTRDLTNNKLFSWVPRALAATDDTFRWLSAMARSKELAMRQVLEEAGEDWTKITPDMLTKAEDLHYKNFLDADGNLDFSGDSWLDKTFKEVTLTSELKGTAAKLDDVFNSIPMIKPFYLFARTGINGLNFSYKNTPLLGALHKESIAILRHTGDDFTELAEYGIKNANDLANARNLFAGRQATGAAVVTSMAGMYMAGQLTGNGPADRQLKQQWINAGWKPNHLYIGDFGFNYASLEPFNTILSSIADIGDNMELMGSEWAEKRLQAVGFVVGRGLTSKTYMSGLDQLMQVIQMKPGALNKAGANILNNSIPLAGLRNEFGKWINPHMKELNGSMWDSIRNRNQLSEYAAGENKLPEKSDLLNGKPINNWNIIGRSFNAISPVQLDIRNDTPGRRLLLDSNYDLKSTTYAYGGYSFVKDAHVRANFQNAIGTVPITVGFKKFKNVEEALNHLASRSDVKTSMAKMKANGKNPALWDVDPNDYPHNTLIDNIMNQARAKAWAKINDPSHKGYERLQELKSNQDGKDARTRDTRAEILELNYPSKQVDQFPK